MSIIIHRPHPYQDAHPSNPSGLPRHQVRVAKARVFMGETAPSPLRSYQIVWMVRLRMLGLLDHLESRASLSGFRYGITLKVEPLFLGSGMGLPQEWDCLIRAWDHLESWAWIWCPRVGAIFYYVKKAIE
jgi:hypothetical protein